MKNYTKKLFIQKLSELQFPNYSIFHNVNEAYTDFLTKFMNIIDNISPLKQIRVKTNTKPWFDSEILSAINVRDKLRKKYKKSGLHIDFEMFKNAQKRAKQITKIKSVHMLEISSKLTLPSHLNFGKSLKPLASHQMPIVTQKYVLRTKTMLYYLSPKKHAMFSRTSMKTSLNLWWTYYHRPQISLT